MISHLIIQNFKVLEEADLKVSNLNLIAGKNSVGKSSVLQSLLLLRQSYDQQLLLTEGLRLQGNYINLGNGKDILYYNTEESFFRFLLKWEDQTSLNVKYAYSPQSDLQPCDFDKNPDVESVKDKALFTKKFTYLSADRIGPRATYATSNYSINIANPLGIQGELTPYYLTEKGSTEIKLESLCHSNQSSKTLIAQVDAWMSDISEGVKVRATVRPDNTSVTLGYQFPIEAGYTDEFSPFNVGFGLTYVLPVVTALLTAEEGDLLLIENPEAHLHPAGQTKLGELISLVAQAGVQVFVETHSDHLLNGIRVAVAKKKIDHEKVSLFNFTMDADKANKIHGVRIETPTIDENGLISDWPKGFFDEWERSLDTLLDF